jgi:hypothetical protein
MATVVTKGLALLNTDGAKTSARCVCVCGRFGKKKQPAFSPHAEREGEAVCVFVSSPLLRAARPPGPPANVPTPLCAPGNDLIARMGGGRNGAQERARQSRACACALPAASLVLSSARVCARALASSQLPTPAAGGRPPESPMRRARVGARVPEHATRAKGAGVGWRDGGQGGGRAVLRRTPPLPLGLAHSGARGPGQKRAALDRPTPLCCSLTLLPSHPTHHSGRADATKEFDDFTLTASLTDSTVKDYEAAPWMKDALVTARTKKGELRMEKERGRPRAHASHNPSPSLSTLPLSLSLLTLSLSHLPQPSPSPSPSPPSSTQTTSTCWSATTPVKSRPWPA